MLAKSVIIPVTALLLTQGEGPLCGSLFKVTV